MDAVKNTIRVTGGQPDSSVRIVPQDAPISIDGKPGKRAEIPVKTGLHALNLYVDQKTVGTIAVRAKYRWSREGRAVITLD